LEQILTIQIVGLNETIPPTCERFAGFTCLRSQQKKIEASTKAQMFHESPRCSARATLKTNLHGPDLAHVSGKSFLNREAIGLLLQNFVSCCHQCWRCVLALGQALVPRGENLWPKQGSEQKTG
jgi:hypothetical protein